MANKIPIQIQAAAELELRRRQKERADNCYMCKLMGAVDDVYEISPDAGPCPHAREQQEVDSIFSQGLIENIAVMYGSGPELPYPQTI